MKKRLLITIIVLGVLLVVAGVIITEIIKNNKIVIDKEKDMCKVNSDCKYIWFTGGCNTPEYVAKIQKEAQEQGIVIGEAEPREGVTCTCEDNACITHG